MKRLYSPRRIKAARTLAPVLSPLPPASCEENQPLFKPLNKSANASVVAPAKVSFTATAVTVAQHTIMKLPNLKPQYAIRPVFAATLLLLVQFAAPLSGGTLPALNMADEQHCLAMNIYHEARSEPTAGKLAVAAVTMNRVASRHYPNSICEVVWQPRQFSWTNLKQKYHTPTENNAWDSAKDLADLFLHGARWNGVGNAKLYHTREVNPEWSEGKQVVAKLGNHLFYRL